ncbi:MAG: CDP-diacylglycerol--serine O-phosphatidyltransferase [Planctomycetes bacterium]|nr:CDP-diacylglycerol--serine O-phosphatidyltransferase [Planctomycetota bacterium]
MKRPLLKRPRAIAVLPTLLTLGNAACGFAAITFATQVDPVSPAANLLAVAGLLIVAAMFFDMVDGSVARLMRQTSDFGAQLDSLADVISFGVAPAILVIHCSYHYHPRLLWCLAVLFVLCALLRLARFNVETSDDDSHTSFIGLPSPAAAGAVASFAIAWPGFVRLTEDHMPERVQEIGSWLITATSLSLPVLAVVLGCLMVSRIRYPHVFNIVFRGQSSFPYLIKLVFAMVAVFAFHELAAPLIFLFFVLESPLRALFLGGMVRRLHSVSGDGSILVSGDEDA